MDDYDDGTTGDPIDVTTAGLVEDRESLARAQRALAPIKQALADAGFYAYTTFDDEGRWSVAVDDELGRVDVRIGDDGYVLEISGTSPGLFAEEENDWRRRAHERLARMVIPNIERGLLAPHQHAYWDEVDQGVGVRLTFELPFTAADRVGHFVRERFPELEQVIGTVEANIGG